MIEVSGAAYKQSLERFMSVLDGVVITNGGGETMPVQDGMDAALAMLQTVRANSRCLHVIGNGGSAAVAAHIVNDFVNMAGMRAFTLHDPSLLTCMTNDYGYENAYARILQARAGEGDLLIGISSSGQSANIRNAAETMRTMGGSVISLSGFKGDNPLRSLGDLNLYLGDSHYGRVEVGHLFLLHYLADRLKGAC